MPLNYKGTENQFQTRFFIGYWIITGVDFNPAPFLFYLYPKELKIEKATISETLSTITIDFLY